MNDRDRFDNSTKLGSSLYYPRSAAQKVRDAAAQAVEAPAKEVNRFEHEGMTFVSVMTEEWWETRFYLPNREKEIGMRRERHSQYPLAHVEEAAKEMATRIRPRFAHAEGAK